MADPKQTSSENAASTPSAQGKGAAPKSKIVKFLGSFFCLAIIGVVILNTIVSLIFFFGVENYHKHDPVKIYDIFESPKYSHINQMVSKLQYTILKGKQEEGILNYVQHLANLRVTQGHPVVMTDIQEESFLPSEILKDTKHYLEVYLGHKGRGHHSWFIVVDESTDLIYPEDEIKEIQKSHPKDSIVVVAIGKNNKIKIGGFSEHEFPPLSVKQLKEYMLKDLEMDKKQVKTLTSSAKKSTSLLFKFYKAAQEIKLIEIQQALRIQREKEQEERLAKEELERSQKEASSKKKKSSSKKSKSKSKKDDSDQDKDQVKKSSKKKDKKVSNQDKDQIKKSSKKKDKKVSKEQASQDQQSKKKDTKATNTKANNKKSDKQSNKNKDKNTMKANKSTKKEQQKDNNQGQQPSISTPVQTSNNTTNDDDNKVHNDTELNNNVNDANDLSQQHDNIVNDNHSNVNNIDDNDQAESNDNGKQADLQNTTDDNNNDNNIQTDENNNNNDDDDSKQDNDNVIDKTAVNADVNQKDNGETSNEQAPATQTAQQQPVAVQAVVVSDTTETTETAQEETTEQKQTLQIK